MGIGTTSPNTNLHIRQKATGTSPIEFLRLEVNDIDNVNLGAGEGPSIDFYVGEDGTSEYLNGRLAVVRNNGTDVDGAGDMVFHTSANNASPSEMMRIRYDGNVGIGRIQILLIN